MPHYLEAMGLLENYPMHAYQQSQKVQRAYERTKMRELYAIDLHNTLSEANTGKLNWIYRIARQTWSRIWLDRKLESEEIQNPLSKQEKISLNFLNFFQVEKM